MRLLTTPSSRSMSTLMSCPDRFAAQHGKRVVQVVHIPANYHQAVRFTAYNHHQQLRANGLFQVNLGSAWLSSIHLFWNRTFVENWHRLWVFTGLLSTNQQCQSIEGNMPITPEYVHCQIETKTTDWKQVLSQNTLGIMTTTGQL